MTYGEMLRLMSGILNQKRQRIYRVTLEDDADMVNH